jgi:hypothetical protein
MLSRKLFSRLSSVLMLAVAFLPMTAEIIDRIAVTIDKGVITESEIERQIRITAFLEDEKPVFNRGSRRTTADRLIEQALIRREIESSHYTEPSGTEWQQAYEEFKRKRFSSDEMYQTALKQYAISDRDVRQAFQWQRTLMDFIAVRFRLGIQIPETEVRDYYDYRLAPQLEQNNKPKPQLEDVRTEIESILTAERVNSALDRWLGQARTASRIRYLMKDLQ